MLLCNVASNWVKKLDHIITKWEIQYLAESLEKKKILELYKWTTWGRFEVTARGGASRVDRGGFVVRSR